jgi:ketol-acid reductoisomerase
MKPGATLGLSHGFLLGVMKNDGVDFRKDINVVLVAPKVGSAQDSCQGLLGNLFCV